MPGRLSANDPVVARRAASLVGRIARTALVDLVQDVGIVGIVGLSLLLAGDSNEEYNTRLDEEEIIRVFLKLI